MIENKTTIRAVDLYLDDIQRRTIDNQYSVEYKTIKELSKLHHTSYNTMTILIGMMGYPVASWCRESIDSKLSYVEKLKSKRVKVDRSVSQGVDDVLK